MTENAYIELWSSGSTIGGKFAAVRDGYNHILFKKSTVKETSDGGIDVTMGGVHELYNLVIRVRYTEIRAGYGTLSTLKSLYELNNPGGSPTNLLWFTNHTEVVRQGYMIGEFNEKLLGVKIEGNNTTYFVNVTLRLLPT